MKTVLTFLFSIAFGLAWAGVSPSCSSSAQPLPSKQVAVNKEQVQVASSAEKSVEIARVMLAPKIGDPEVVPVPTDIKPVKKSAAIKKQANPSAPMLPLLMCSPALLNRIFNEKPSES
jgi:hypothetical protein